MSDTYTQFFGNAVDAKYRLDQLSQFAAAADILISEEAERFATEWKDVDPELGEWFAEPFPAILHSSVLVGVVILLEREIRGYSSILKSAMDLPLGIADLSGSLVERFSKFLHGVARIPNLPGDGAWNELGLLVEARNCLVHSDGLLREFKNPNAVLRFAALCEPECIEENRLVASRATSNLSIRIARAFLEAAYDSALHFFPPKEV